MAKTQILNEIYILYSDGKYSEAKELNDNILQEEPNNIYAKRYENLLEQKVKSNIEPERKGPIPTVNGKSLKCPHCLAKISFSALTQIQKDKIRNKQLENLEIKCPYCHTVFMLQNKKVRSLLGIKIGEKIIYKQKQYRSVGYIEYDGRWMDNEGYSGEVYYLEWILLGQDNSYLYFSEGYSVDDGRKIYEYEFSQKSLPIQALSVNFEKKQILASGIPMPMTDYSKVQVKSAYGENAKSFKIGEVVELAIVKISGNYVYEKESSGNQVEVGVYKTDSVSEKGARIIFNKNNGELVTKGIFERIDNSTKIFAFSIVGFIFMFTLVIPVSTFFIETKQKITLENIDIGKKYEIEFTDNSLKNKQITRTQKYDYGGIKTYYTENIGIKFSVESQKDINVIKKIKEFKYKPEQENRIKLTNRENIKNRRATELLYGTQKSRLTSLFDGILYKLK